MGRYRKTRAVMRPARCMRLYAARLAHDADMFDVAVTPSDFMKRLSAVSALV